MDVGSGLANSPSVAALLGIPGPVIWAYFVGACFIAAAFSLVARVQASLAATLLALTFFLFVVLMDAPAWAHSPHDRFVEAVALRELSFSGGGLALTAGLTRQRNAPGAHILATVARYFIAVPGLFYSFEQFVHGNYVPGIPLNLVTPRGIYGHAIWTYLAAVWLGLTVLFVVVVVYVPFGIMERASILGVNYLADTLMYCGAVLLLAGAMPRELPQA